MKKPLGASTIVVIMVLALIIAAIFGPAKHGFTIHGITTFFGVFLVAWIVFALIARAIKK